MDSASTIWLTGLSLSGKTALANRLAAHLCEDGHRTHILDGKAIRTEVGDVFGYSKEERLKVNRLLCAFARVLSGHGVIPIVTAITPYQESREFNRQQLRRYLEIYVDCPVEVCRSRDASGLYERAIRGDLRHFVGVDDPFEIPKTPDLRVNTAEDSIAESTRKVCSFVDAGLSAVL